MRSGSRFGKASCLGYPRSHTVFEGQGRDYAADAVSIGSEPSAQLDTQLKSQLGVEAEPPVTFDFVKISRPQP